MGIKWRHLGCVGYSAAILLPSFPTLAPSWFVWVPSRSVSALLGAMFAWRHPTRRFAMGSIVILKRVVRKTTVPQECASRKYTTVYKSSVRVRNCLKIQWSTTQLSSKTVWRYATVSKFSVHLRNCHQNMGAYWSGGLGDAAGAHGPFAAPRHAAHT